MNIKLDHINLTVRNIEESREWYKKMFDFLPVERGISPQSRKFEILARNDFMICMSEYKDQNNDDGQIRQNHRIYHFGVRVDNEEEWINRINTFKVRIKYNAVYQYPHSRSWYVEDPNGHEIEVSFTKEPQLVFPKLVDE